VSTRLALRLLLLVQAAFVAAFAWLLLRWGVLGAWPVALAAGAGVVLLVRVAITANNFVMTARFASVTPDSFRLGLVARLRLFAEEFMATLLHSSWFMARATPRERIYAGSAHPPVLLLHGYGCNSGYWAHLTPLLDAARISHAALDLEPVLGAIDDYVPLVQRACASLCTKTNASKVIIVAHSMGGLVARAYLAAHGPGQVAHVFTLGTPHHGTSLASFGLGRNAAQMRRTAGADAPESAWLQALAAAESAATRALITSLFTHHDNIVAPQTSSLLAGARSIEFGGVGHVAMGRNRRVLARLMAEIATVHTQ
jgi:triacylglycerol esterase/lipase EstA (alpha/beta hydrolase family)